MIFKVILFLIGILIFPVSVYWLIQNLKRYYIRNEQEERDKLMLNISIVIVLVIFFVEISRGILFYSVMLSAILLPWLAAPCYFLKSLYRLFKAVKNNEDKRLQVRDLVLSVIANIAMIPLLYLWYQGMMGI